jgi:hypothetical protein
MTLIHQLIDILDETIAAVQFAVSNFSITTETPSVCPGQTLTFRVVNEPVGTVQWIGGGNPATGAGPSFTTRFDTSGPKTVTATITSQGAQAQASQTIHVKELSGPQWVGRYQGSNQTTELTPAFQKKVDRFISELRKAGANVSITATYRPPERAYLMHYAWKIAKENLDPQKVNPAHGKGVQICWVHRDTDGNVDLEASKKAAEQMIDQTGFNMAHSATLTSNHSGRRAIDMTITWANDITVNDANGRPVVIAGEPRTGGSIHFPEGSAGRVGHKELHKVGASYGVKKLLDDPPHWSDDGG